MKRQMNLLLVSFVLMLSACVNVSPSTTEELPSLAFEPRMTMFEAGKVHFELGVHNRANRSQPALDDVNIRAVITDQDGDVRNQLSIIDLGPIEADKTVYPLTYEAVYTKGIYEMTLTAEGIPTRVINFEIREEEGVSMLAAAPDMIDPHTEFTIDDLQLLED